MTDNPSPFKLFLYLLAVFGTMLMFSFIADKYGDNIKDNVSAWWPEPERVVVVVRGWL